MSRKVKRKVQRAAKAVQPAAASKAVTTKSTKFPVWPLNAPGMPVPCGDILRYAKDLGDELSEVTKESEHGSSRKVDKLVKVGSQLVETVRKCLYSPGDFMLPYELKGYRREVRNVVGGHLWEPDKLEAYGPKPARVMVIGKMLGEVDQQAYMHFFGEAGKLLLSACRELDIKDINDWYMTSLIKTIHPEGVGQSTLRVPWIKQWLPILHQELRLVCPDFILCVGADASKALLGKHATVTHMEGRVAEYEIPRARSHGQSIAPHRALVMTIMHPSQVLAAPELYEKFCNQLSRFGQLLDGIRWDKEEDGLSHRTVWDLQGIRDLAAEIEADIDHNLLSFDAEWHGQHPQNKGSYLRTVQLSWKYKTAAAIIFVDEKGKALYDEDEMDEIREILNELVKGKRLAAHFGDADLEWLEYYGFTWQQHYHNVPSAEEGGYQKYAKDWLTGKPGGFDTGLAAHALLETDDFSLTSQALKLTGAPRYDMRLLNWKKEYCKEHGLKDAELEGFGPCPDRILLGEPDPEKPGHHKHSYACYDADVVWRMVHKQQESLLSDAYGNMCWEPFWVNMRAQPAVLEINCTGMVVDRNRVDELTELYLSARNNLQAKIRNWARWPNLNLNSVFEIREFLFGAKYNGKERKSPDSPPVRLRPPGAISLGLEPIITTDKRPMQWRDVKREKLEDEKTPSTNKTALELLRQEAIAVEKTIRGERRVIDLSDQVMWIRDFRFISQVLKSSLRPPELEEDESGGTDYVTDDSGHYVYSGGLASAICSDGRVRTHIYPTKETGRWSSARPPLQNLTKRREVDYKRILGDSYKYPLRTILGASEGKLLVEADYVGAELFGMAIMSGDEKMIEHAQRNQLPEDHPDHYDIHSNVAVLAFKLDCEPTKKGLKEIGKADLRICAKAVVFGIAYGRQAKAIALQCREEGVPISVDEAQAIINTVFDMYPGLVPFFQMCQNRAREEKWLVGCFGRFRRFPRSFSQKTVGEFERQAMNFPIQGMIADAVSRAVDHLYHYRENFDPEELDYRIVLQVHDAVILETEPRHVERVKNEVLPVCMVEKVPIFPTSLDGVPTGSGPYHLGIDVEVCDYWGHKVDVADFLK